MAVEPIGKFTFSFADLALPVAPPRLQVLDAAPAEAPPEAAGVVEPTPRPRWLPRLLPVFRAAEPMRIDIAGEAAPPFAARLLRGLAALYAAAGADSGVRVLAWDDGLGVGGHGLERLPSGPQALAVAAELEPRSLAAAARRLGDTPPGRGWLILHGDLPRLDAALGVAEVAAGLGPGRLVRLPLLGQAELSAIRRGVEPGIARRRFGRPLLGLAAALARAYLELPA
jgi:hypothetical protein